MASIPRLLLRGLCGQRQLYHFTQPCSFTSLNGALCSAQPETSICSRRGFARRAFAPTTTIDAHERAAGGVLAGKPKGGSVTFTDVYDENLGDVVPFTDEECATMSSVCAMVFNRCANTFCFNDFIQHGGLPDTADTWYRLTVLHIWLVLSRVQPECSIYEYRYLRDGLRDGLTKDAELRLDRLTQDGHYIPKKKKILTKWFGVWIQMTTELDEALLDSDSILFGAIWRNLYVYSEDVDLEKVEIIAKYFRREVHRLAQLTKDDVYCNLQFLPLLSEDGN